MSNAVVATPTSWHSPGKIWNLGHRAVKDLFSQSCIVEEKIDGSFFAFGSFDGELRIRSKGAVMIPDAPEGMFKLAAATARRLHEDGLLKEGWTYRGEYLMKPKHNALAYDRVPQGNIIIFDILTGEEEYLGWQDKYNEARPDILPPQ